MRYKTGLAMTFGIWNIITGKIYTSDESRMVEDFSEYIVENNTLLAVPKDYVNSDQNEERNGEETINDMTTSKIAIK